MIRDGARFICTSLSKLFFVRRCTFCDSPEPDETLVLCPSCSDALEPVGPRVCFHCGRPFDASVLKEGERCGRCLAHPPRVEKARYGLRYAGGLRNALIRFKYHGALYAGPTLGELLRGTFCAHFSAGDLDLILPVPLHRNRLLSRGFNQVVILGEMLARSTGIPLDRTVLRKVKDTPPQVGLPRDRRLANVRRSFGVADRDRVRGKRVLIIDDVSTTGSTLAEAAKTVLKAGGRSVSVLALALRSGDDASEQIVTTQGNAST